MNRYAAPISERVPVSRGAPDCKLDVRIGVSPRILTDVEIHQDSLWSEGTSLVSRVPSPVLDSLDRWFRRNTEASSDVLTALKLLVHQGDYDAVVTSGLRTSQIFGFLRTLLRTRQPPHIHLELMLDEEKSSLSWKLKRAFQRLAFASTDLLITSSAKEIDIYSDRLQLSSERFRFVLFHTNVVSPGVVGKERGYAFSAGRSGRDYQALASAVAGLDLDLVVLGDAASLQEVNFPDRTQVLVDQPYERYLELLHGCDFVIVPLNEVKSARGQVVILEAMAVGKPVIATETVGTEDYIEPGVNGFLVPPGDVPALRDAIRRLHEDSRLRERLRQHGLKDIQRHTFRAYVESVLGHVEQAVADRG